MSTAVKWAGAQVAAVRDDPAARVALMARLFRGQPVEFSDSPTGRNWYRAHNASIVGGYLEHHGLAEQEREPEPPS